MTEDEIEADRVEDNESGKSQATKIPRSRAEAARRTKALLKSEYDEEERDEPKKKKRKESRKRSKQVSYKKAKDNESNSLPAGKYLVNPRDIVIEKVYTSAAEESEGEEEDLNESDEMSTAEKYGVVSEKMRRGRFNTYGDSTYRKFDPTIIHNIESEYTLSACSSQLLSTEGNEIPTYNYEIWSKPFKGLISIRPDHLRKSRLVAKMIDEMTGVAVTSSTKKELVKNLDDLVRSKLKDRECAHLVTGNVDGRESGKEKN